MIEGINHSGDPYFEFWMSTVKADERIRITLVRDPKWGTKRVIHIQKRDAKGHLFKGPQFPVDQALLMMTAIGMLTTAHRPDDKS